MEAIALQTSGGPQGGFNDKSGARTSPRLSLWSPGSPWSTLKFCRNGERALEVEGRGCCKPKGVQGGGEGKSPLALLPASL